MEVYIVDQYEDAGQLVKETIQLKFPEASITYFRTVEEAHKDIQKRDGDLPIILLNLGLHLDKKIKEVLDHYRNRGEEHLAYVMTVQMSAYEKGFLARTHAKYLDKFSSTFLDDLVSEIEKVMKTEKK